MKRIIKQSLLFVVLLVLLTIIRFPIHEVVEARLQETKTLLKSRGTILDYGKIESPFFGKIAIERFSVLAALKGIPAPIPLVFEHVSVALSPLQLLLLRAKVRSSAVAYSGRISGWLEKNIIGSPLKFSLNAQGLQLGNHPLLALIGVTGTASLRADGDSFTDASSLSKGKRTLILTIDDGSYEGKHKLYSLISLPKIDGVSVEVNAEQNNELVDLKTIKFMSSLGQIEGSGSLSLTSGGAVKTCSLAGTIELTSYGASTIGGYLSLQSNVPVDNPSRNWSVTIEKKESDSKPKVVLRPVS